MDPETTVKLGIGLLAIGGGLAVIGSFIVWKITGTSHIERLEAELSRRKVIDSEQSEGDSSASPPRGST